VSAAALSVLLLVLMSLLISVVLLSLLTPVVLLVCPLLAEFLLVAILSSEKVSCTFVRAAVSSQPHS
jgi:hypothetical protein